MNSFRDETCGWTDEHDLPIMRSFHAKLCSNGDITRSNILAPKRPFGLVN